MMPRIVRDEHLDDGIRDLVINLNRIPGEDTLSNCEGHERYCPPVLPVKGGWLYVVRTVGQHQPLIDHMGQVCLGYNFVTTAQKSFGDNSIMHDIFTNFEEYEDESGRNLFEEIWTPRQRRNFFRRAKTRKVGMLRFWSDLDSVVRDYIVANISKDITSLPYRDERNVQSGRMCDF